MHLPKVLPDGTPIAPEELPGPPPLLPYGPLVARTVAKLREAAAGWRPPPFNSEWTLRGRDQ